MRPVLIIDDDVELCSMLRDYLAMHGFDLCMAHTGRDGLDAIRRGNHDVVLLDIMLPDMNGYKVLSALREFSTVGVLLLTTLKEEADRVAGLECGADDFVPKPFSTRELVARIRAMVRRQERLAAVTIPIQGSEGLSLNLYKRVVSFRESQLALTDVEFALLKALFDAPGAVLSREDLTNRVLDRPFHPFDRSVDMHISRLRKKLESLHALPYTIKTVRSSGYVLVSEAAGH